LKISETFLRGMPNACNQQGRVYQTNLDANMGKLGRPEDTGSATLGDRDRWSVFVINKGQAHRRAIEIGHRNQSEPDRTRNMQTTRRFELLD
jgi:hypothetical protein